MSPRHQKPDCCSSSRCHFRTATSERFVVDQAATRRQTAAAVVTAAAAPLLKAAEAAIRFPHADGQVQAMAPAAEVERLSNSPRLLGCRWTQRVEPPCADPPLRRSARR